MVSVTSAPHSITSASRYHPCNQSRCSMYIHGLIPPHFAESAEAVPIGFSMVKVTITDCMTIHDEEIDKKIFLASPFEPRLPFTG